MGMRRTMAFALARNPRSYASRWIPIRPVEEASIPFPGRRINMQVNIGDENE
jgi:hypothetical protein